MVSNMKSLNERIGEAMLSLGKIKFVVAYDAYEEHQLKISGFTCDGKIDISDKLYSIFSIQHNNIKNQNFHELSDTFKEDINSTKRPQEFAPWDRWVYLDHNEKTDVHNFKL